MPSDDGRGQRPSPPHRPGLVGHAAVPIGHGTPGVLPPVLHGQPLPARRLCIEHEGNRCSRDGDWKLVAMRGRPWEFYYLSVDPLELDDLAGREGARVAELAAAWDAWAAHCGVTAMKHAAPAGRTPEE